jgi:hypothetical protein
MNRKTVIRIAGTLAFLASGLFGQKQAEYFPLHVGDTWVYNYGDRSGDPWSVRKIQDERTLGGVVYYRWVSSGSIPMIDTVRTDSAGNVIKLSRGEERVWFDFTREDGAVYPAEITEEHIPGWQVSVWKNQICETPLGVFGNCVVFVFDDPQSMDDETWYYFAPAVGMVRRDSDGWSSSRLTSAVIDHEPVSGLEGDESPLPALKLAGNYPNPFNGRTRIPFTVSELGRVTVRIFDVSGCEVRDLLDRVLAPGDHAVDWDAEGLPGGAYLCRLETASGTETVKMLLLK